VAAIELVEVCKSYGQVAVVDRLSLQIRDGEFICFLGPSGCGKSTLLRMIAGLEEVNSGQIRIDGARIDHFAPGLRGVAMVFQHYALYPHMTVFNNMAFGLRNTAVSQAEIDRRIEEAAQVLEIKELLGRTPSQLSGGQRQRVAIGRALVKQPKAYLFDEPLSNLDAALRLRTRFELARLHQRTGATMIFVTHDQVEAMTLADRIVVMNNRRIEQVGTPLEVYERPASRFVAEFVGSPPMNLLEVAIAPSDSAGVTVTFQDGRAITLPISLQDQVGQMTFGVRAEDVSLVPDGNLHGTVQVVERLGDRTLVHVALTSGETVIATAPGALRIEVGTTVSLRITLERTHLFDAEGAAYHAAGEVRHD
jgi:multiple sugar transport system ATP-binding protein